MNPGDKALERIIAELTSALAMTGDARLATLKERAIRYAQMRVVKDARAMEEESAGEVTKQIEDLAQRRVAQHKLFERAKGTTAIWQALREIYRLERPLIEDGFYSPYIVDWPSLFTPIEMEMWCAIRCFGRMRFFPQYPVGRYFVDFGDPWRQIAIECDGAQWHNAEKDAARDAALRRLGWTVHRIKGRDCFASDEERRSCFGLLRSIFGEPGQGWELGLGDGQEDAPDA